MTSRFLAAAGTAALLSLGAASQAQAVVTATLTFDEPSAVVANNVSIPVWVTLALSADSEALKSDASANVTSPDPSTLFPDHPEHQPDHFQQLVRVQRHIRHCLQPADRRLQLPLQLRRALVRRSHQSRSGTGDLDALPVRDLRSAERRHPRRDLHLL